MGDLLAISDLHVQHEENREIVRKLRPGTDDDWLVVAGDIGDHSDDVRWGLDVLSSNFAQVVWVPGNHELWTRPDDPLALRGEARYQSLVEMCRGMGVLTPEDPFATWETRGGPVAIAPLFVLYDYSFRPPGIHDKAQALALAQESGVVCTDEFMLHPDPYPSREAWCSARLAVSEARLSLLPDDLPTVLINHFPLVREPTRMLRHPQFELWCGTSATEDWPQRFRAASVVYGHLHIPRSMRIDGIPHYEVSLGYPREWRTRAAQPGQPVTVLSGRPSVGAVA
ncbi:metallophosphoesterase family protein [Streptomyces sp. NPDC102283]|uniref:metallophosphoesterase family protein n=1 Tax=Streptomyces sp. NPDC102283 TaxID=3366155 RepID=UPI00380D017F